MMSKKQEICIVACLRQNARTKMKEIAKKADVAISTVFERVRDFSGLGIKRLSALLDFPALGFNACSVMLLKAGIGKRDALREFLLKAPCVNSLSRINNGFDFVAECIFRDLREHESFCELIEREYGVKNREVHFVIEELKREHFLTDILHTDAAQ
jgi:DNA-binding Lrp family transcriptional regulator